MRLRCVVRLWSAGIILGLAPQMAFADVTGVTFSASPVPPGTDVIVTVNGTPPCSAVEINFGDGADITFPITGLPFGQHHTYQTAGSFTVTATGHGSCTARASATLTVATPVGHVTDVSVSPSPTRGTPLTVTVFATPPCGTIQIDFGDGTTVNVPGTPLPVQQTHTYTQAQVFTLLARGQTGCGGQVQHSVSVATPLGSTGTGVINTQPAPSGPPRASIPPLPSLAKPDLVADLAGSPTTATFGTDVSYAVAIRNVGNASASNFFVTMQLPREVDFVRADNNTIGSCERLPPPGSVGGALVKCTRTNPLNAGSVANALIVTRPITGLGDNTTLRFAVLVDPNNAVAESNENNNVVQFSTLLHVGVDLAITSITVDRASSPSRSQSVCSDHANTTVRVHVVNSGPGGSLATKLGLAWVSAISSGSADSDCPSGTSCSGGACVPGAPSTSGCFESCDIPSLLPNTGADVVIRVLRNGEPSDLGVATIDPSHLLNDPNRANNVRHVQ
jgi:uncharacterized repeat protein (TIGR01451 family)